MNARSSDIAPRVAAVAFPALLLAGWGYSVWQWESQPSPEVARIESTIDAVRPEVLLLGNSITRTGIDVDRLQSALGATVSMIAPDEATSADWVTMLAHRVLERGARPELVIIPTLPIFALDPRPRSAAARSRLMAHLQPGDVAVRARIAGRVALPWIIERIRAGVNGIRDALIGRTQEAVMGDVAGVRAARSYFGGALRGEGWAAELPVREPESARVDLDVASSLVPELVALAGAHDVEVVFVNMPTRAMDPRDEVPPEVLADLTELLEGDAHADFVDLTQVPVPEGTWIDDAHVGPSGARAVTDALIGALETKEESAGRLLALLGGEPEHVSLERHGSEVALTVRDVEPRHGVRTLSSARAAAVSDLTRLGRHPARPCTPLRVTAEGETVPARVSPDLLGELGWVGTETGLRVVGEGALDVWLTHRGPACADGLWTHGGGSLHAARSDASGRWDTLELEAGVVTGTTGAITVELRADGQRTHSFDVAVEGLAEGLRLELDPPLEGRDLEVSLRTEEDGPSILWQTVWLREDP